MIKKLRWIVVAVLGVLLLVVMVLSSLNSDSTPQPDANSFAQPQPAAPGTSATAQADQADTTAHTAPTPPPQSPPPVQQPAANANDPTLLASLPSLKLTADDVNAVRNKLRHIGIAMHNYHDTRRSFPPGRGNPRARGVDARQQPPGQQLLSWRVHLLPFLEQQPLYDRFHLNEPWDSPHNIALLELMPDIYRSGSESGGNTRFVVFTGERMLFPAPDSGRPGAGLQMCRDGTSNTLLVIHSGGGKTVPWTKPEDVPYLPDAPLGEVGLVNDRFEAVLASAAPISLPGEVKRETVRYLATPMGNEIVDGQGLVRRYSPNRPPAATTASTPESQAHAAMASRDATMRRVKEIAMAMHHFENTRRQFPPAVGFRVRAGQPAPAISWRVQLLPYLEQEALYRQYKVNQAWDEGDNRGLLNHMPSFYRHDEASDSSTTRVQVFRGENTPFGKVESDAPNASQPNGPRGPEMKRIVDGTSKTIMFVESGPDRAVSWTQPRDLDFDPAMPVQSLGNIGGAGAAVAMFDGSVRIITPDIDPAVFRSLVLMNDESGVRSDLPTLVASTPPAPQAGATQPDPAAGQPAATPQAATPFGAIHMLERPAFHAAYDLVTGNLMVAEYENNQVTLYKLDDKLTAIKQIASPARPSAVLAKRFKDKSYFVVGGELDKRLDVFDADTGERAKSVYIDTPMILHLASAQAPDDPYVYYVSRLPSEENREYFFVGRFSLESAVDEGLVFPGAICEISPDGKRMYTHSAEGGSGRIQLQRIVPRTTPVERYDHREFPGGKAALELIEYTIASEQQIVVGPGNTLVALGPNLYAANLKDGTGFPFDILAFATTKPWAAGIDKAALKVASVNDMRVVAEIQLSEEFDHQKIREGRAEHPFKHHFWRGARLTPVFIDQQRGRIIATTEDRIAVASWDALKLPDQPLIATKAPGEVTARFNEQLEIPLETYDPRVKVRIASGPPDAAYQNGKLLWKPAPTDIGVASVLVESTFEHLRFEQTINISVSRPGIALPFAADHVALSPDGKLAVVWSQTESYDAQVARQPGTLALVDLAAGKVLATKTVEKGIWVARINNQGVFVLTIPPENAGPNMQVDLFRLNIPDLSLGNTGAAGGMNRKLELLGEKFVWAAEDLFTLPDLKEIESYVANYPENRANTLWPFLPMRTRLNDGWFAQGVVWDNDVERAQLLFDPQRLPRNYHHQREFHEQPIAAASWGLAVKGDTLVSPPNQIIMQTPRRSTALVLRKIPAVVVSEVKREGDLRYTLNCHELEGGGKVTSIPLAAGKVRTISDFSGRQVIPPFDIDAAEDHVVACAGRQLYVIPISEIQKGATYPEPFHFRWRQDPLILSAGKSARVDYEIAGGEPPFELKLTMEGVESRAQVQRKGTLNVDVAQITQAVLSKITEYGIAGYVRYEPPDERPQDFRDIVRDYSAAVKPQYKLLTGRDPRGVPVLVHAVVEATDRNLKTTRLTHYYLLDLSESQVVLAYEAKNPGAPGRSTAARTARRTTPEDRRAAREEEKARAEQLAEINRQLARDYVEGLGRDFPAEPVELADLKQKATAARDAANAFLLANLGEIREANLRVPRVWSDKKGHTTKAELKSAFADQVVLKLASGNEVTVPIEKLSDHDQRFLADSQRPEPGDLEFLVAKMTLIGKGMVDHAGQRRCFPPAYIIDDKGRPLLSWRVAILPYIGGEDLLRLFKLDEPWNSPHNRALLPYMPTIFAPGEKGVAAGRTTILALRHPRGLMAGDAALTPNRITDGYLNVAAFAEARPDKAIEWTRPDDIRATTSTTLKAWLHDRGGAYLVGFLGGKVQAFPQSTSQSQWLQAIDYQDGTALQIPFQNPLSLNDPPRNTTAVAN
jgi:hypothetical protein